MKNRLVLVKWQDAESSDSWLDINSQKGLDLPLIETIGMLIDETDEGLVVAQNFDPLNEAVSMIMRIPKGMIKKVYTLKRPPKA